MDAFGIWTPTGGEVYVRTTQAIVSNTQDHIAAELRIRYGKGGIIGEAELLSKLAGHLHARGCSEEDIENAKSKLTYIGAGEVWYRYD